MKLNGKVASSHRLRSLDMCHSILLISLCLRSFERSLWRPGKPGRGDGSGPMTCVEHDVHLGSGDGLEPMTGVEHECMMPNKASAA